MKSNSQKGFASAEQGNGRPKSIEDAEQMRNPQGFHRALLYRQPSRKHESTYSTVVVSLERSSKRVSFSQQPGTAGKPKSGEKSSMVIRLPAKSEGMASKGTQTDYRESEVQTLAWKHEVKAEGSTLQQLLLLDWLSSEKNFPLGMDEVRLIEARRQQLAWENVMKRLRGRENESRRRSLVLKTTSTEAGLMERRKEEEIGERIEMSRRDLKEAREAFEEKLRLRLLRSYGCKRLENDSKIGYWHHQLTRKIRKMKSARSRSGTRPDVVATHKDKASDLYAPKLRDGQNPSLGHEVIQIQCRYLKRFHGLEILGRHLSDISHLKFSKSHDDFQGLKPRKAGLCPRRLREKVVAKPKEMKFGGLSLKVPVLSGTPGYSTPVATKPSWYSDAEENLQQASLLLKKLIRGRAVQTDKFAELFKMKST